MTAIVTADDKSRITVRGTAGKSFLVVKQGRGWWIEPAPQKVVRPRKLANATRDLSEHLDALAAAGFTFEPSPKTPVPPCRF